MLLSDFWSKYKSNYMRKREKVNRLVNLYYIKRGG